jgi:hypothetical protein
MSERTLSMGGHAYARTDGVARVTRDERCPTVVSHE